MTVCRVGKSLVSAQLDKAKEALISLPESLLVKDLDGYIGGASNGTVWANGEEGRSCARTEKLAYMSKCWFQAGERVRLIVFVVYV